MAERLTRKVCGSYGIMEGYELNKPNGTKAVIDRLAAYEDTGLTPEEIHELLHKSYGPVHVKLGEWFGAEQDGWLVKLPCKVGDTVYMPVGRWNTITGYEEDKCDGFYMGSNGILQIKAQCYTGNHGTYGVPGKTVFLTREEAETALAARREQK